jgi:prepilin-type processing-associated H-X9-DG protein
MRLSPRAVAFVAALAVATLSMGTARAQEGAKPAPLARFFPPKEIIAYAEFDGLDAHGAAWKKTATYKLLTETSTGAMLDALATQAIGSLLAAAPPGDKAPKPEEIAAVAQHLVRSGFAFGVSGRAADPKSIWIGLVIRGGAKGKPRVLVDRLIEDVRAGKGPEGKVAIVGKPGNRPVNVFAGPDGSGFAWWNEQDDLAFCINFPTHVDAMIDALDGRAPSLAADPTRNALAKGQDGFEPVGLAFVDLASVPNIPPRLAPLGLDKIKRLDYRWGFQEDALVTITRIIAPAPRPGVMGLFDAPTFTAATLPPIPASADEFTVFSMDLERVYDRLAALAEAADPEVKAQFFAMEDEFLKLTGRSLRADVLRHIGPRVAIYTIPVRGNLPSNPISGVASALLRVPKTVTLVELRDPEGFAPVLDALVIKANDAIRTAIGGDRERSKAFGFTPLKGDAKGWVLVLPPSVAPMAAGARPTFLLGKKYLVIGTTPDVARKALALEGKPHGLGDGPLAKAVAKLPGNLTFAGVSDTRESLLPEIIANLPALLAMIPNRDRLTPEAVLDAVNPVANPVAPQLEPAKEVGRPVAMLGPDMVPDPDEIRRYLFPSMYAITVDDEGVSFLSRESVPGINPTTAAPIAAALFLPAMSASRSAARRSQSTNNMKQIGLAMFNYEAANGHLPGTIRDKDGKALLSWRVQLLPYLEEAALYNEFKLDEPWDSAHNKPLMDRMPMSFTIPGALQAPGMTYYRGFSGASTLFDPEAKGGVKIADITDGTSNTIAVVEAKEAVEWTRPDNDLAFDNKEDTAKALLPKLGGHFPGGFNTLFLDGSVRFIKETINLNVLRALITRNGGEVIANDSF